MFSLSCISWLLVILVQAVVHFKFLGRKTKQESNDDLSSPLMTVVEDSSEVDAVADQVITRDSIEPESSQQELPKDHILPSALSIVDSSDSTDSDGDRDSRTSRTNMKSQHELHTSEPQEYDVDDDRNPHEEQYDDEDDHESIEEDDEWRYKLLEFYYENNTLFLDESKEGSLEPMHSINMLCEKLHRKQISDLDQVQVPLQANLAVLSQ